MERAGVSRLHLSQVLDLRAAKPLAEELLSVRGRELTIEAQDVERLGGLCLQVMLSADLTWARDGMEMRIEAPSPAFCEAVRRFGGAALEKRFNGSTE